MCAKTKDSFAYSLTGHVAEISLSTHMLDKIFMLKKSINEIINP